MTSSRVPMRWRRAFFEAADLTFAEKICFITSREFSRSKVS